MKVRCIRIVDEVTGQQRESDPWLSIGQCYRVLAVWVGSRGVQFRLVGDQPTPALFSAEQFELVSGILPQTWVAHSEPGRFFELAPAKWTRSAIWSDFFDGDAAAVAVFERERKAMEEEDDP